MQCVDFCIIYVKQAGDQSPLNRPKVRSHQNFPRHTSSPLVVRILVGSFVAFLSLATPWNCVSCWFLWFLWKRGLSRRLGPPQYYVHFSTIFHYKPHTIISALPMLVTSVECPLARIEVQRCPKSGACGNLKRTFGSLKCFLKPCFGRNSYSLKIFKA